MSNVIDEIKPQKMAANSVVNYLKGKGVKDEEIKWSGIETFLEGKKSVSKEELQEFAKGSMLQIEEKILGEDGETRFQDPEDSSFEYSWNEVEENAKLFAESNNLTYTINDWDGERDYITITYYDENGEYDDEVDLPKIEGRTKWHDYTTKGATNYHELLFKMPGSDYSNNAMRVHWGESGVLAHARIDDIKLPSGEKMLFVEEIQSDWHNEGKKNGYGYSRFKLIDRGEANESMGNRYAVRDLEKETNVWNGNDLIAATSTINRYISKYEKGKTPDAPLRPLTLIM